MQRLRQGAVLVLVFFCLANRLSAQEKPALYDKPPTYAKVNVAVGYQVDPKWPSKPDGVLWGAVSGIAVDKQDRVFVFTRSDGDPVQIYSTEGKFLSSWGKGILKMSHHIKIDSEGNVWTADLKDHVIQKFTSEGTLLLTLGTPGKAGRDKSHFWLPTDIGIAPDGDIFVSDGYGNQRVVRFDKTGKYITEWGESGSKPGQFSIAHAITVDSKKRVYVADRNNARIQVFDEEGKILDVWNNLVVPWGFCMLAQDEFWVCGSSPMQWRTVDTGLGCPPKDQVFMKLNSTGRLLHLWTIPKGYDGFERPGELNWVHCIAQDSKGNLYAGDIIGKRAQKFVRVNP
jgi:streptogramin lyase